MFLTIIPYHPTLGTVRRPWLYTLLNGKFASNAIAQLNLMGNNAVGGLGQIGSGQVVLSQIDTNQIRSGQIEFQNVNNGQNLSSLNSEKVQSSQNTNMTCLHFQDKTSVQLPANKLQNNFFGNLTTHSSNTVAAQVTSTGLDSPEKYANSRKRKISGNSSSTEKSNMSLVLLDRRTFRLSYTKLVMEMLESGKINPEIADKLLGEYWFKDFVSNK